MHRCLVFSTAALVAGCVAPELSQLPESPAESAVHGVVVAVSGAPIAGAAVTFGERSVATDAEGRFAFDGFTEAVEGIVRVRAPGHGTSQRGVYAALGQQAGVRFELMEAKALTLPSAELGGRLQAADGVAIELPANSLTFPDGRPVTGAVDVEYTLVNRPELVKLAPNMTAQTASAEVELESFGMVEVNLFSEGEELVFEGPGRLEIPLAETSTFAEGDRIPLWSFDEAQDRWVQEGEGVVEGGRFVADVTHYTWWNADVPMTITTISGRVEMPGDADPGGVSLQTEGVDYTGMTSTVTDADGTFCIQARRGSRVKLLAVGAGGSFEVLETPSGEAQDTACAAGGVVDLGVLELEVDPRLPNMDNFDNDGDGYTPVMGDCDDADNFVHPAAADVCDAVDNNCNGWIDEEAADADGDGVTACAGDCDDARADVFPGAPDVCDDRLDNDCDTVTDAAERDGDGDGLSYCAGDCNDADAAITDGCALTSVDVGGFFSCGLQQDDTVRCWTWEGEQSWAPVAEPFAALRVGHFQACGLTDAGAIRCWTDSGLVAGVPEGDGFRDLAVGEGHGCAIGADDAVMCWGDDTQGQLAAPAGAWEQLVAGRAFTCARDAVGATTCWGSDDHGQLAAPSTAFESITAGAFHACGLQADGRVQCWGRSGSGEAVAPPVAFASIDAGWTHTCGLLTDGTARCWGLNLDGEATAPRGSWLAVSAGNRHSCGVRSGGQAMCWGLDAQ